MLRVDADRRVGLLLSTSSARALVGGLAITQTVGYGVIYYAFSPLLVPMQDDLGWSRATLVAGFTLAVVISGLLAPIVGRHLDRTHARTSMTAGSVLGVAGIVAWSQVHSPFAYLVVWSALGVSMALVLYEPAFTVIAKRCAPNHRRAITAVTLVAGLASFIFQPITGWLTVAHGWRATLMILAVVLAVFTIPIHSVVLRGPEPAPDAPSPVPVHPDARFWGLTASFSSISIAASAVAVLLIAHLVDEGWSLGRAALAGGTLGAMQLPGRLAFGPAANRLPHHWLAPGLMLLPGLGLLALLAAGSGAGIWAAVLVLGFGQGATTLLRSTLFVDLYGTASIGRLSGISATPITVARALSPLGAAGLASVTGFGTVFVVLAGFSVLAAVGSWLVLRSTDPTPSVHPVFAAAEP